MPKPRSTPALAGANPGADRSALTPEDYARRLEASAPVLWTIAAGTLGSPSSVEDVLQEAALIGLEKLGTFQPGTQFTAWMGRVVRYVALNHLRRRGRHAALPLEGDPELPARSSPSALGLSTGVGPRGELEPDLGVFDDELLSALRILKPLARACLLLKTVSELDYKEISATLEIPIGTAMSHVHRSRDILRRELSRRAVAGVMPDDARRGPYAP